MTADSADAGAAAVEAGQRVADLLMQFWHINVTATNPAVQSIVSAVCAAREASSVQARAVELTGSEWLDVLNTLPESPGNAAGWELALVRRTIERVVADRTPAPEARPVPVDGDGLRAAIEALTFASDDGTEYEHNGHASIWEGEPECPGCWVDSLRAALAQHTADPEEPT